MPKEHSYIATIIWTGNLGTDMNGYHAYSRNHVLQIQGKPDIPCSSEPGFRGDPTRYSPEELLVAALSACHMLWYLHLCVDRGIVVSNYADTAIGIMRESDYGRGHFTSVVVRTHVRITAGDIKVAVELHVIANRMCFIANSVKFPVGHKAVVEFASAGS